LHNKNQI